MFHDNRIWCVTEMSIADAASKLAEDSFTLCSGIRCGTLTLLNDSTGPDRLQEYAVLREGRQIESLTVSWMKRGELLELLLRLDAGQDAVDYGDGTFKNHSVTERCPHCA